MLKPDFILREMAERLTAVAALAGTGAIWKVTAGLQPEPDLPRRVTLHTRPFCMGIKVAAGMETRCVHHDIREIAGRIGTDPSPYVSSCHAGVLEVIVPIVPDGKCAGAVMVGPFRGPGTVCCRAELREAFEDLPELDDVKAAALFRFVPELFTGVVRKSYVDEAGLLPRRPQDERILAVLEYLRGHYTEQPTVADAAARVYLSSSRLLHLFKAECGIGFGSYLGKLRLRRARGLLLASPVLSVGEVAERSGFRDQSHFTAIFRREYGLPPLQFRRKFSRLTSV